MGLGEEESFLRKIIACCMIGDLNNLNYMIHLNRDESHAQYEVQIFCLGGANQTQENFLGDGNDGMLLP